jgi:hypothetical protein
MSNRPDLAVLEQLARAIPTEDVPALLGELERVKAIAWARLVTSGRPIDGSAPEDDRLMTAHEVHVRTSLSVAYVYRHADTLPFFARRVGRKVLFSEARLTRWLARRSP